MVPLLLNVSAVGEPLDDLADRWRRARCAALRAVVDAGPDTTEDDLLASVGKREVAGAERRVFENSLRLGASFARYRRRPLALGEIPALLRASAVPCLAGAIREADGETALLLERDGCDMAACAGLCDHWREALSGIVHGAAEGVLHSRHESRGHGGRRCVDVFHGDPESPLRFGPIPEELKPAIARASRLARAFDSSSEVRFLGLSEGVLFYELRRDGCHGGEIEVTSQIERAIRRDHPALAVREASPRPVMSD